MLKADLRAACIWDGWKQRDIVGNMSFFPKARPITLILFVGGNTLNSCYIWVLNLTNSFREDI